MIKFLRLMLRPIQRFLAQCISISIQPRTFVQERVHLGDTTNFLRRPAFSFQRFPPHLAEIATLHLLGNAIICCFAGVNMTVLPSRHH